MKAALKDGTSYEVQDAGTGAPFKNTAGAPSDRPLMQSLSLDRTPPPLAPAPPLASDSDLLHDPRASVLLLLATPQESAFSCWAGSPLPVSPPAQPRYGGAAWGGWWLGGWRGGGER
eukprot:CAMPEP_0180213654 /NCGR_PEP_ID=MMETSP0987-20121128/14353_1 /TAXON_ID=697907 /ORGANISM="non described non described, Strain CCMP2293" /LENGTH=116 /DNA_ID=CAMNT_0022171811 /DNA_START=214 /DNA_END=562 /DNA_ORIENTATION=+